MRGVNEEERIRAIRNYDAKRRRSPPLRRLNMSVIVLCLSMNANTKLELIRDMAKSKVLELQPFAGEEMNLPQTDPHHDGFIDGERTLAARILAVLDDGETERESEPVEEEMVLSLGQT
jgi:hypothetical protein